MNSPIYENKHAYILREEIKGKVRFVVYRKSDERPAQPAYTSKEEALKYAKHLETYKPLWEQ